MSIAVSALGTGALTEIRVARAGDVISPDDADLVLTLLLELLDLWNLLPAARYVSTRVSGTLTPSLNPHQIGPSGAEFTTTTARPTRISALMVEVGTDIWHPIDLRDRDWWDAVTDPETSTSLPYAAYYEPAWPNGKLYLYPEPSEARDIRFTAETLFSSVAWSDTLDLPMGYQAAVRLTLAERCAPSFGQRVSQDTMRAAREARAAVFGANRTIPRIATLDAGLPGARGGYFDMQTGENR